MDRRHFIHGLGVLAASGTLPAAAFASAGGTTSQHAVKVVGIGGAGGNIVDRLMADPIRGIAECVIINADAKGLGRCNAHRKLLLGNGGIQVSSRHPERLALEARKEILGAVSGADIVFVISGLGGRTGTVIAPAVAMLARQSGAHVVALLLTPFDFEGLKRNMAASEGLAMTQIHSHMTVTISNQLTAARLGEDVSMLDVFSASDSAVLNSLRATLDAMPVGEGFGIFGIRPAGAGPELAVVPVLMKDMQRQLRNLKQTLHAAESISWKVEELHTRLERQRKEHVDASVALHDVFRRMYGEAKARRKLARSQTPGPSPEDGVKSALLDELSGKREALEEADSGMAIVEARFSILKDRYAATRDDLLWNVRELDGAIAKAQAMFGADGGNPDIDRVVVAGMMLLGRAESELEHAAAWVG